MKKGKLKMLFAAMLAGVFLLSGCGAAEENEEDEGNGPIVLGGASNLILFISSPEFGSLHNRNNPLLTYSVTEGLDNRPVDESRLGLVIHDFVDGEVCTANECTTTVTNLTSGATLPTVGDGLHQLQFVVTDQSGAPIVTVFINYATDITPPEITFTSLQDNPTTLINIKGVDETVILTNDPTPAVDFTVTDNEQCYRFVQDADGNNTEEKLPVSGLTDVLVAPVTDPETIPESDPNAVTNNNLSTLDDGLYQVTLQCMDLAENVGEETIYILVDATEPQVNVIGGDDPKAPPPDPTQPPVESGTTIELSSAVTKGTLTFTSDESGDAQVLLDGTLVDPPGIFAVVAKEQNSIELTLGVGNHDVTIKVTDVLGNVATLTFSFTVVAAGFPTVTIVSPSEGELLHPAAPSEDPFPVTLEFTVSDDVSAPGEISVTVTLETWTFNNGWSEDESKVVDIPIADFTQPVTGKYTKPHDLSDGHYRLVVQATDTAGNVTLHPADESIPTQLFHVDTTAPEVLIISPVGTITDTNTPVFQLEATELCEHCLAVFLCEVKTADSCTTRDDFGILLGTQPGDMLPPMADGDYELLVEVTDAAGFTGSDQKGFSINAVSPTVIILNPEDNDTTGRGSINLKYRVHDASNIEIFLVGPSNPNPGDPIIERVIDPVQPRPRTYEDSVELPVNGEHTITVRVFDRFGSFGVAEDSVTFEADSRLPGVLIITPNEDDRNFRSGQDVPLTFTFSDNTREIVIALDGRVLNVDPAVQPINLKEHFTPDGIVEMHNVKVTVSNANGSNSDDVDFFIDDSPPVVTLLSPADGSTTTSTTIALSYTVNDPNNPNEATKQETVILDDAAIDQRSGNNIEVTLLGEHTISVQVVDLAGNPSNVAGATFTIIAGESDGLTTRSRKSSCFIGTSAHEQNTLGELVMCQSSD